MILSVYEWLIIELIWRCFLTIPVHVKRVLTLNAEMAVEQWREETEVGIVHWYTIGAEPTNASLEMDGIPDQVVFQIWMR